MALLRMGCVAVGATPPTATQPLAHEGLTGLTGVRLWGLLVPTAGRVRRFAERVVGAPAPSMAGGGHRTPIPSNPSAIAK